MDYRDFLDPEFPEYLMDIFNALDDDQKRALLAFGELLIPKEEQSDDKGE